MAASKAPISEAIATVARDVIAPSLKIRGFRKERMHWYAYSSTATKTITLQSSQFNIGVTGKFTIELGFSYPALGESTPDCRAAWCSAHHFRVSKLLGSGDRWWSYDDASDSTERTTVAAEFERVWSDTVLPFLDSSDDPRLVRDILLTQGAVSLLHAASMSRAINEPEIRDLALDRYLAWLASDDDGPQSPFSPASLHRLVHWYAVALPELRATGRTLQGADKHRAISALQAAAGAIRTGELRANDRDTAEIAALGDHVGFETTGVEP